MEHAERAALDPMLLAEIRRIQLRTRLRVDSDLLGNYRSSFRGSGLLFSDLREYQPGDDVKHIHWKVTARTGKVFVKSYEEERSLQIMIVVDISNSAAAGSPRKKIARSSEFAALVTLLASRSRDAVGLCLFSDEVEAYLPPRRSRNQLEIILSTLLQPRTLKKSTNLAKALSYIRERTKRHSVIFIVSDLFTEGYEQEIELLSRRNDVILSLVDDSDSAVVPDAGLVEFEDAESGERITIDTSSPRARVYLSSLREKRIRTISERLRSSGADLIQLVDNPVKPLSELMRARQARIR